MKKLLSAILVLTLVLSSFSVLAYSDISEENELLNGAVNELTELKIIDGYPDNTYRPENNISRAETSKILRGLFPQKIDDGESSYGTLNIFSDIDNTHWAYESVEFMNTMGVFVGDGDGYFRPEDNITNAEFITTLIRLLGYESLAIEKGAYPAGYLQVAAEIGITKGVTLKTDSFTQRSDAAIMLSNLLDIPKRLASGYDAKTNKVTYVTDENNTYRNAFAEYDASLIEYSEINPHE